MKRRKVSVEKDCGHRESFARSSVPSLRATGANRQGQSRSAKPMAAGNLNDSASSDKPMDNCRTMPDRGDEARPARTKCNSRDVSRETRPISSPRLKSFPAERIKKLDNPSTFSSPEPIGALIVQQDSREGGTFFVGTCAGSNNGQGDAISPAGTSPAHQRSESSDAYSANRQQVAAVDPQIAQTSPQPESLLTGRVASPERQAHRPFVPNVFQTTAMRDRSPRRPPTMIDRPFDRALAAVQQPPRDTRAAFNWNGGEEPLQAQLESQPIDSQNAVNHERLIERQARQQGLARAAIARDQANARSLDDRSNDPRDCPGVHPRDVRSSCHGARSHGDCSAFHQNLPRQIYQQPQHGAYVQQMLPRSMLGQQRQTHDRSGACCDHHQQSIALSVPGQGMTSPQDMTMNRTRSSTRRDDSPVRRQNFDCHVDLPSVAWPQDDRWMQTTDRMTDRQHAHCQATPRWWYCCQPCDTRDVRFCQRSFENPDRSASSQNQASRAESVERRSSAGDRDRRPVGEQTLPFTPDMIRDQELLVSTMRQQAVPEDVMRRQFNALLNEQRRHLAYVAQFQRREDSPEPKGPSSCRVARRRADGDEKPEWMVHITPPRLSYGEVGRTQRGLEAPREIERANARVQPRPMYFQTSPRQPTWQQRTARHCPYRCDHQTPRCYAACDPYDRQNTSDNVCRQSCPTPAGYEQQQSFRQYPRNVPAVDAADARYAYPDWRRVRFQESDASSSQPIDAHPGASPINPAARFYEQMRPATEPSSLLKMRVYKEMIRPQGRNNGLQDLDCVRTALEELKDPASRKGLEYLANLARRKPAVRLNGTQNPDVIPADMELRPPATADITQTRKRAPANGLENGRNPDNPATRVLRPRRADEAATTEYPRQKRDPNVANSVRIERADGATAISRQREDRLAFSRARNAELEPANPDDRRENAAATARECDHADHAAAIASRFADNASPYHRISTERYHHPYGPRGGGQGDVAVMPRSYAPHATRIDRAGGDNVGADAGTAERIANVARPDAYGQPGVCQARTGVSSVAYPASKPDYIVHEAAISPEKLIAGRHLQPPMIL